MGDRERDQAIVSKLYTIATRTWEEPTGPDRTGRLNELTAAAGGRTDLLAEAAGILLGTRPDDDHDPRHRQHSAGAGAEMLLELAQTPEDDPKVQRWVPIGAERRTRWRRPETPTGWGV
jgi:hypothetical protein